MIALRMRGMSPPVDRSITVSAPYFTEYCSFSSSSSMFEVVAEFPIFALILHLDATPMHIGSRFAWLMLAGMIIRPRATSARTSSRRQFLAPGDILHLFGDDALARVVHLRPNRIALALRHPFCSHDRIITHAL